MSQSQIITLSANTAASVTFVAPDNYTANPDNIYSTETYTIDRSFYSVEVVNRDGGGEIWFTANGSVPTVAGNNHSYVPAVTGAAVPKRVNRPSTLTVWLISDAAVEVYVEVI